MSTKVQLTGGAFQDSEGNLLANGTLKMKLNQDGVVNTNVQVCSGVEIIIQLDSNGNVASSSSTPTAPNQYVWGNDQLSPVNSYYRVTGYTAKGQPAWGPNNQQVLGSGGTFDVGTWVPNLIISWTPPVVVQSVELQTNEVDNGSQTLLDLHAGTNITLTDNGSGRVTIDASGTSIPSGLTISPLVAEPVMSGTPISSGGSRSWFTRVPGACMTAFPSSWKIVINVSSIATGTGSFSSFCVYRTLPNSVVVIDRTAVKFGGTASPTWTTTGDKISDATSLALDSNHDYWFFWYDATGNLTLLTLPTNTGILVEGGEYNGNLTTYNPGDSISLSFAVFSKTPLMGWQAA
jgi:uncharacterized protein YcfL